MGIIKDLISSILIVACIGAVIAIVFYDDIAIGKVIPDVDEYALNGEMKNELQNNQLDDAKEIIINYYIDASDLKYYENENQYVKGKTDPFAQISNSVAGNATTNGQNKNQSSNLVINKNSGFYEDDGTK